MPQPPAFQFYASDYLSSSKVQSMSLEAEGAYIRLLCYNWQDGSLPADIAQLARLCKTTPKRMAILWDVYLRGCFEAQTDGRLVNRRLEEVRSDQEAYRDRKSTAGAKGAAARWQPQCDRIPKAMPKNGPPPPPSSPPPLGEFMEEEEEATPDLLFETWGQIHGVLPECRKLTEERRKHCRSRLASSSTFLEDFKAAIARAQVTPFLRGEGAQQWQMNFDFLIRNNTNVIKVLEGRYDRQQLSRAETESQRKDAAVLAYLRDRNEAAGGDM